MARRSQLSISKQDKIWLQALYDTINQAQRPSYRYLRAKLYKKLPSDYNPNDINPRLARYRGEEITLEGVAAIDPKRDVINKANLVIRSARELLINEPEKSEVTAVEIANKTNLDAREVSFLLQLISPYGRFWTSASSSQDFPFGLSSFRFDRDNEIFDQYLYFTNINDLIFKSNSELYRNKISSRGTSNRVQDLQTAGLVTVNPIFKSRIDLVDPNLCFVLMPFKQPWSDEIYKLIKTTVESLKLQCLRADNLNGSIIIEDIWAKIYQAGIIIADVTDKNPNVMYEVGIAHTIGRPTLLLTQSIAEIPFDFTHLRHLKYQNSITGAREFKKNLKSSIESILEANSNARPTLKANTSKKK